jgi:EAL domain-containing protein (putative c-di-GMP-specific phosphodiesterase class I)
VNVSGRQLQADTLLTDVNDALALSGLDPATLIVELTESTMMTDVKRIAQRLSAVRALGVRVAIDDFGTGYSSLRYLRDLEVDWLKVDRSFITGLSTHASSARIVESTIVLAHALGIRVVAEGVEDKNDWDTLSTFGCDAIQGYLLTPPLACDEITTWLDAHEHAIRLSGLRAA